MTDHLPAAPAEPARCIVTGLRAPGGSPFSQRLTAVAAGIAHAKAREDHETLVAAEAAIHGEFGAQAWHWLSDPEAVAAEVARRKGAARAKAEAELSEAQAKLAALSPPPAPVALPEPVAPAPAADPWVVLAREVAELPEVQALQPEPIPDDSDDEDEEPDDDDEARGRDCPTCGANPGEACVTAAGNPATRSHSAR